MPRGSPSILTPDDAGAKAAMASAGVDLEIYEDAGQLSGLTGRGAGIPATRTTAPRGAGRRTRRRDA